MVIVVVLGWVLAVLTLPGVWIMLLAAALINWLWWPGCYSWWTIGVCGVIALWTRMPTPFTRSRPFFPSS